MGIRIEEKHIVAATVRRHVVLALIMDLKHRGHPAYVSRPDREIDERTRALPENGPLPALINVFDTNDRSLEKVRPQKNSSPGMLHTTASDAFTALRPNAVVCDRSTWEEEHGGTSGAAARKTLRSQLRSEDAAVGHDTEDAAVGHDASVGHVSSSDLEVTSDEDMFDEELHVQTDR